MTGVSGVGMHVMHVAAVLNVNNISDVRLAALGYLMSTKAHSFHEVMFSTQETCTDENAMFDYYWHSALDCRRLELECGTPSGRSQSFHDGLARSPDCGWQPAEQSDNHRVDDCARQVL